MELSNVLVEMNLTPYMLPHFKFIISVVIKDVGYSNVYNFKY